MERRLCNRIDVLLEAEEQVFIEHGTELVPCSLQNLSGCGALVALKQSDHRFSAGDPFKLFFENGGELLELSSAVVWSKPDKIAFRFCDLTADQSRAIHTKLIRMGIISARLAGGNKSSRIDPDAPPIYQRDDGMSAREGREIEEEIIET